MRFDGGTNPAVAGPFRSVNPHATTFHGKHGGRFIFYELRHPWRARFPFRAARALDEFREAPGDSSRRVGFAIALDWGAQQLGHALQNVHGAIFSVATQANHRGNIEIELPKSFGHSIGGPILFLARDAGARTEVSHQ